MGTLPSPLIYNISYQKKNMKDESNCLVRPQSPIISSRDIQLTSITHNIQHMLIFNRHFPIHMENPKFILTLKIFTIFKSKKKT
jgi:hypothetical protein